jgi:hypothetical protein
MGFFRRRGVAKPVDQLTPDDLARHPVWEYAHDEEGVEGRDETWVRPVKRLPITDADNRVIGTTVRLAGGRECPATLGNLDVARPDKTRQFLVVAVYRPDGTSFGLARYFDPWLDRCGPEALAAFLGLPLDEIFPIAWDVSTVVAGDPRCTRGVITLEPEQRLDEEEVRALIFS